MGEWCLGSLYSEVANMRFLLMVTAGLVLAASACSEGPDATSVVVTTIAAATTQPVVTPWPGGSASTLADMPDPPLDIPQEPEGSGAVRLFWPSIDNTAARSELPLIVLVPGGGWVSADPAGLVPLAEELSDSGAVVATITYRTATDGAYFPTPAEDVACAISRAVATVREAGHELGEVVVVGHSAGAQLGALVALRPTDFSTRCSNPTVTPNRFIGLAGPYDVVQARNVATDLFGPDNPDVADWSDGNPVDHASRQPGLSVLLIHGMADRTVPIQFTQSFATALADGGHRVDTVYPDTADHHTVYAADVAAPLITDWLTP